MLHKIQTVKNQHKEQGFTLIELLVVILIIGILAAIAVPMFLNQRKSAADAALRSDIKNAATVVETGIAKYPTTQCINRRTSPTNGVIEIQFYANTGCTGTMLGMLETRLSDGTNIMPSGNPASTTGYTLRGWNSGGTYDTTTNAITFISGQGGFQ